MPVKIYMVTPEKPGNGVTSEMFQKAEQVLYQNREGFNVEKISHFDVLNLGKTKCYSQESIFVVCFFGDKAFEYLASLKCRIYGIPCILQCLQNRRPLPKRNHPTYAIMLNGVTICCSSLDRDSRERMFNIVQWLGGDYTLDLTTDVSHLITNKVGSAKYIAFLKLNKPIVKPDWIDQLWSTSSTVFPLPDNFAKTCLAQYVLPAFAGLTVCTSGFKDEERRYFKKKVEENGGVFTGQLRQNECTHLIIREISGEKYEAALQWGTVKIVGPSWLQDSVNAGCCFPEGNYAVQGPRAPKPGEVPALIAQTPISSNTSDKKYDRTNGKMISSTFMSNCFVYLYNLSPKVSEELKKSITAAGGIHIVEPLECVTHVVCELSTLEGAQDIVNNHCSLAHVVSPDWVLQSYSAQELLDERNFDLLLSKGSNSNVQVLAENTILANDDVADISVINDNRSVVNSQSLNAFGHDNVYRIGLDGYKQKDERLIETVNVLSKVDCSFQHLNSASKPDIFDLLIIPFGQTPPPSVQVFLDAGVYCVNSLFIEVVKYCLNRQAKYHKNGTRPLHKILENVHEHLSNPLMKKMDIVPKCLSDCCITLTGFEQPERTLLTRLVIALGAAHQENFARTASSMKSMQLQRSTHLIAAKPQGEKFERAKHWGVPVLKKEWLLECWNIGVRVNEETYSLLPLTIDTTLNETISDRRETPKVNSVKPVRENTLSKLVDASISEQFQFDSPMISHPVTTGDEKTSISRRLNAILAAKSGADPLSTTRNRPTSRPSPVQTPRTPSLHSEHANFAGPMRPAITYGVDSSQSLQVMWGDDGASNKFSLGFEKIEEEPCSNQSRLKSLTLVEDALSSPNASILNENVGQVKSSPTVGCNSNSEPVLIRAPDAVVVRSSVGFGAVAQSTNSRPRIETNIATNDLSQRVFQFTGLSASERDDAAALLERLGAKVVATPVISMGEVHSTVSLSDSPIEATCTHLIVAEPSRTQKFLSGIASGKWLLHRSYIDACRVENRLVDESPYEWGSGRCGDPPPSACKGDTNLARRLAAAAHRWRTWVGSNRQKAFAEWRVILLIGNAQVEHSFKQILLAGGATIVQLPADFSPPQASSFTHWLVEPAISQQLLSSQTQSTSTNSPARLGRIQVLKKHYECLMKFIGVNGGPESPNGGGCVVRHDFLQSYLLEDPVPNIRKNLINASSLPAFSSISSRKASVLAPKNISASSTNQESYAHPDKRLRTSTR